jgi:hypothetical protein
VTVAHQPLVAFIGALLGVASKERGHLRLDRLGSQERAPLRSTSVKGSENVAGWVSSKRYRQSRRITPSLEKRSKNHPHDTPP